MDLSYKIKDISIPIQNSILVALKQMDSIDRKLLLVFDKDKFVNVLSLGDIQRAILKNLSLDTSIKKILRIKTRISKSSDSIDSITQQMEKYRIECMPVVDNKGDLVEVYFWEDIFSDKDKPQKRKFNLPVVIMAGGKGERLKPLTNVMPKPLMPIGEKTIVEEIINRFVNAGCDSFSISINYKAKMIKHYFEELDHKNYNINFLEEEKSLGTAGSLFLIKNKINSTFFVSNCDIIINEDYSEILNYHQSNNNELTIVSALKHFSIPYGTIKTQKEGILTELIEKPELTFQINSGMYILEPHLLEEIPNNKFFHITHLIENIKKRNGIVGVFPVTEKSWIDIGELNNYLKIIDKSLYSL